MTGAAILTDEELTAYLDGEADAALRLRIDSASEANEGVRARLDALRIDIDDLQAGVLASLPPAPPSPHLPESGPANSPWPPFGAGLAAGIGIAIAVFALQPAQEPANPGWTNFVASYQVLYTPETLNVVNQTPEATYAQLERVSTAVGRDLTKLPQVTGLTLKRAQVLGFRGRPLVQIAYQKTDGTPVALCIIATERGATPVTSGADQGLNTMRWTDSGHDFLLIGDMDTDPLRDAAIAFAASL